MWESRKIIQVTYLQKTRDRHRVGGRWTGAGKVRQWRMGRRAPTNTHTVGKQVNQWKLLFWWRGGSASAQWSPIEGGMGAGEGVSGGRGTCIQH